MTGPTPASGAGPRAAAPPVVVLVHGIGVSGRYFAPLERELADRALVVVPDLPGFGGSPPGPVPLTIGDHADVVATLVGHLGLDRPVLLGHSMGAQVVTEVAARRPDLVGGLVLVGAVAEPGADSALRQGARLARDIVHEPPSASAVQLREWLRCGVRWYAATVPRMLEYPTADRVGRVAGPLLLVRGSEDPVSTASFTAELARRAPFARVLTVPGAGHIAWWAHPRRFADAVLGLVPLPSGVSDAG